MRVGAILLDHGWVDAPSLERALAEQRHTGKRICSLLIARGILDPDHASRALGEQHAIAAALQRHLAHRDPEVARLVPATLARAHGALPIGHNREGQLIVCVRDPRPGLDAVLARATGRAVVLAAAPAAQLEPLIELAFGHEPSEPSPEEEFDVDMSTGNVAVPDELAGLASLTLVGLDDARVAKDPSQSGQLPIGGAKPLTIPPLSSATPVASRRTLDDTLGALARAATRDEASDLMMRFAHGRWVAALLLAIKEGAALGHRGHGTQLSAEAVQAVALPLSAPSIVKLAHDHRRLAAEVPQGAIQDRLLRLLGQPRAPLAMPVLIAGRVGCVLAVGDALGGGEPAQDLERLASALGEAYSRILRDTRP
jgi:hypothetical protein